MAVEMQRVSTCKKNYSSTYGNGAQKSLTAGNGMYTFVYGKGSNRVSMTKHCSEAQAKSHKEMLEGQGY